MSASLSLFSLSLLHHWISVCLPYNPFVLSSVKPREVLMYFTAMTWSTSCSITTLWSRWWPRTSRPTWRPWGSSPKVCCHGLKRHSVLVRHLIVMGTAVGSGMCTICCLTDEYVCLLQKNKLSLTPRQSGQGAATAMSRKYRNDSTSWGTTLP